MTIAKAWRLWQPAETLETITAVLSEHWRAAKQPFNFGYASEPVSWLCERARKLVSCPGNSPAFDYHLTTGGKLIR